MSAEQLKDLWDIVRENEKTIAVLQTKLDANDETLKKLIADNAAFAAILNKAIGARTIVGVIGAVIGAVITWVMAWLTIRNGGD